jgi:uncharacterized iron-regulated membrane protein
MFDKLALYALAGVALAGLGWLFNHQINARVFAETRATQAELVAELAERERDRMAQSVEDEKKRADLLADELDIARAIEIEANAVLQDRARFDALTAAKPGLLEIKAQKATTRVWETIAREANARPD